MFQDNIVELLWNILYLFIFCKIFCMVTCGRCKSKICLNGKAALITGGCSGIGLATALDLAARGCRVIIADIKDDKTVEFIIKETNNPNVTYKHVDLKSFKSVRQLAKNVNESEERLDILINNAGIAYQNNNYTDDGIHELMQVNYFSHFLLTHLLIDTLKKSAPSRIIFVSSVMAYCCSLSSETLLNPESLSTMRKELLSIYSNTKAAMAIASLEFADKLAGSGVTSNALHPGIVRTNIFRTTLDKDTKILMKFFETFAALFGKNSEEGCQTTVQLACAKELENVSGKFFWDCIHFWQPPSVYNEVLRKEIWKLSENTVKLLPNELIK